MSKIKIIHKNTLSVTTLLFSIILYGCQTTKQSVVSDYRLQLGDLESIIQSGNWLKFFSEYRSEPYTGTLNPGRMITADRKHHILKFENREKYLPFTLKDGDTLSIILDGRAFNLTSYNTSGQKNKVSAYFEINKWDLVDIGNASEVVIILKLLEGELKATFTKDNIYNYRYFASKYVLGTKDVPPYREPAYEQPWAFLGGGVGSGTDFWFGYYTNILKIYSGWGDYLAAGMGIEKIDYSRYNYFSSEGYLWDGDFRFNNYNINLMYGITYPSPFGNWSFELGITYQYFFFNENWNSKNSGTDTYPTIYKLKDSNPYEGSAIGVFFQAGGFWAQFNSNQNWAIGISIPIPWW